MSVSPERTMTVRQTAQDRAMPVSRRAAVQGRAMVLGWMMLALLVRLVLLRDVRRVDQDGLRYLIYAQHIARGDWFHPAPHWAPYPPFYPLLTVLVSRSSGLPLRAAGYAVSIACGAALVGVLFLLARHLFGTLTGHVTALLAALNGHLITYSDAVLSESTYYLLVFVMLYLVVRVLVLPADNQLVRPGPWLLVLLPFLAVAIALTREVGGALPATLLAAVLVLAGRRASRVVIASLCAATIVGTIALVSVASAIQHRLTQVAGHPVANYLTQELSHGLHDGFYSAGELRGLREPILAESPLRYVHDNVRLIAKRAALLARNDLETGIDTSRVPWNEAPILPFYLIVPAVLGVYWAGRTQPRASPAVLMPLGLLVLPNLVFVRDPRYYVALVPVTLLFVAYGLVRLIQQQFARHRRAQLVRAGGVGLIACLYLSDIHYIHPN